MIETMRRYRAYLVALSAMAFVCFLGFLGINQTVSNLRMVYPNQGKRESIGELVASSRACQTFVARYNNLDRIDVLLVDYGRQNSGPFYFYLRASSDDGQMIATLTKDASTVKGGDYYPFQFPPIPDSAQQSYAFCLEAPEAELLNSITAMGLLSDTYPDGEATFRDMWAQDVGISDLDFRADYAFSAWDKLVVFAEQMTRYKPLICGDWRLYLLLGLFYLALLYSLFQKMMQQSTNTRD
ncbi:MAG: hypothetical protein JXA89_08045 [Anaerolineae bacterium]|nr:hypothetical protein [Anaerolineae bacterium]